MSYTEGSKSFKAGEDLVVNRLVKVESGTVTDPPEVVYADAGEDAIGVTLTAASDGDQVAVRLLNDGGTFQIECLVDSAIARGASLYAGASGVVTDASSGSVVGIALEAGVDNATIEVAIDNRKPTTAAGTTVADSGALITAATVEAALAEAFTHIQSAQHFIPVMLHTFREVATNDIQNLAAHGGLLASDSTPALTCANGDTDGCLILTWTAEADEEAIIGSIALPPNLDTTADLVLHFRAAMEATNDTPTIASDAYFNEGDTKVEDASAAVTGTSWAEYTITIAAADIPAGAQTLSIELTPAAHSTDDLYVNAAAWLEYTGTTLTA